MISVIRRLLNSCDRTKFIKTILVYSINVALGLNISIPGPTLLDLQHHVGHNTTLEDITLLLPARSGGYALGSILRKYTHAMYVKM